MAACHAIQNQCAITANHLAVRPFAPLPQRQVPGPGSQSRWRPSRRCSWNCRTRGSESPVGAGLGRSPSSIPAAEPASASVPAPAAAASTPPPAAVLAAAAKTQLLRCTLGSGSGTLWLEVVRSRQGRVEAVCAGELLQLSIDIASGEVAVAPAGFLPRLGDAWVKSTPGLPEALKKVRQQQESEGSLPSQLIAAHGVAALEPAATLVQFRAEVAAAPGLWCDGTAPGDPPLSEAQQALLTAGELTAFLAGLRGVCLLQLHKGWGDARSSLQPLLRPWVLTLLAEVAGHKGAALLPSAAPGAPQLGASLVLCARQQPFHAWGKHLAAQGVQAAIVADSPFYKLLIGRILGYKPANIYHHIKVRTCTAHKQPGNKEGGIQSTGGWVSGEVVEAVEAELATLSSAPPKLPWVSAGRRR